MQPEPSTTAASAEQRKGTRARKPTTAATPAGVVEHLIGQAQDPLVRAWLEALATGDGKEAITETS
jgi:hypothetical protein